MIKAYSLFALVLFCIPRAHADLLIANGGFESNGGAGSSAFTGWTVATQGGSGGSWYAQTGSTSPQNGLPVQPPTGGSYAAMTDSLGPSSQALLQTFTVSGPGTVQLSFDFFRLDATDGAYDAALGAPPDSLDYIDSPNQQARVDILTAGAGAFDLGSSVLDNVLVTSPLDLDPNSSPCFPADCSYQHVSVDISSVVGAGGTYQLRFAEVDDLGAFVFGVDDVSIDFTSSLPAVPEPSSIALLFTGICLLAGVARSGETFTKDSGLAFRV